MKENKKEEPFFAKYLEAQDLPKIRTNIKAGGPPRHTLKYPSDNDEGEPV
jgi:hypothetical protein